MVRRAYEELSGGAPTRLIAFSDDTDGLRKVPDNGPKQAMLTGHLGEPLSRIPDPFGTGAESFAHHNNATLRRFIVVGEAFRAGAERIGDAAQRFAEVPGEHRLFGTVVRNLPEPVRVVAECNQAGRRSTAQFLVGASDH